MLLNGSEVMNIKISKAYEKIKIFDDFELNIVDHKINVILGPSGCGKTTLLKCIAQICDYEGQIDQNNRDIGYVFQEDRLFPYLNIYQNLTVIENNESKIKSYLQKFNVSDLIYKYPNKLSGGEKQRISIIRAFLGNNDLVLMDEPFKSLDFNLKMNLMEMIREIYGETNKTIILVTHDLDIALSLGHVIHILSNKVTKLHESINNPYFNQELDAQSIVIRNSIKNSLL